MQANETRLLDVLMRPLQFIRISDLGLYESFPDLFGNLLDSRCSEPVMYYDGEGTSHRPVLQHSLLLGHHILTAIFIFLVAFARVVEEAGELSAVTSRQLRKYYLLNDAEDGLLRYKLLPQNEEERESMI